MGVIRASNAGTGTILEYLGLILIVVWVCLTHGRWPRALRGHRHRPRRERYLPAVHARGAGLPRHYTHCPRLGSRCALTLATYTLLPARLIAAYGANVVVAYGLLIAGACVGLVGRVWRFDITWTLDVVLAMFITVVLGTTVAFTAYLWGVDRIGPVRASLVGCVEPIAATGFSTLIMGSSYTGADIVGMALIIGAVVTISLVDLIRARRVTQ